MVRLQQPLGADYPSLDDGELSRRIAAHKARFGRELVILAHHYQRDEIVQFADFVGDSLKLSRQAAGTSARYIVFCGVDFMAESADVLSGPEQIVLLPHLQAGCTMSDMADEAAVAEALDELASLTDKRIVPVTYVNSSAAVKALTARWGGACCTSSNARGVFEWALRPATSGGAGGDKVFAIPDQNLGVNTAVAMGYGQDACAVYDPQRPGGGLSRDEVARTTFILWKGFCYVHQRFRPEDVHKVRAERPDAKVIVHPECPRQVVALADASGSTEQIIAAVDASPAGSAWAVGTESNLVRRLARRHRDKFVRELSDAPSLCRQMGLIDMPHLLWLLDELAVGRVVNRIRVPESPAVDARVALQRMIDIKPASAPRER